jgi:hypothetical protein
MEKKTSGAAMATKTGTISGNPSLHVLCGLATIRFEAPAVFV